MNTPSDTPVVQQLREQGFDVKTQMLTATSESIFYLQITDASGITFYMPESATFEQCQQRYLDKLKEFTEHNQPQKQEGERNE